MAQTYHYTPASNFINLTWQADTAKTLNETSGRVLSGLIDLIETVSGGASLSVTPSGGHPASGLQLKTTSTPAQVAALTGIHVLLDPVDTTKPDFYVNARLVTKINADPASGSNSYVTYSRGGIDNILRVVGTPAAIAALVNGAQAGNPVYYAEVTVTGSVQGDAAAITLESGNTNMIALTGADNTKGAILPASSGLSLGTTVKLYGNSANTVFAKVYPASGEQIENLGANAPIQVFGLETIELTLVASGSWQVNQGALNEVSVPAAGTVFGDATRFSVQNGQQSFVKITGANGSNGVGFDANLYFVSTIAEVFNQSANAVNIYPPTGGDFGAGVNVPIKVAGWSTTLFVNDGGAVTSSWYANASAYQSQAHIIAVTKQANTGLAGLTNPAIDTVALTAANSDLFVVTKSANPNEDTLENRALQIVFKQTIEQSGATTTVPSHSNIVDVAVVQASPNNFVELAAPGFANYQIVQNSGANPLVLENSAGTVKGHLPAGQMGLFATTDGVDWQQLTPISGSTNLAAGASPAIAMPAITANSVVTAMATTIGGTQGILSVALNPGVGFTINSSNALDTSTVAYTVKF